ncbi:MAG: MarR family winged helix-turn-helix transcriptional regulator [Rhodothermaceae bacterium]
MDQEKKFDEQINVVNTAFHEILFAMMFRRQDNGADDIQKFTFAEMHLMGLAYYNPDMILKEIRDYLNIPQTTLSSIVAKLEKNGYLKRVINPRDMRSFSLELTEKGKSRLEMHQKSDYEQVKSALLPLSEEERESFKKILGKIMHFVGTNSKIKH